MKIVFWSPMHGQTGTTSNLLAISLLSGMLFKKKTILTHTHFNLNNLEAPLVNINSKSKNSEPYFQGVGIDALIRNIKAASPNKEMLENCSIGLPNTNVSLLPGTIKNIRESFENDMELLTPKLFRDIEEFFDIIFIDVCSGNNAISKKLIDESDLTVINLSQNINTLETLFTTYDNFITDKVFYLFGYYDRRSKYNLNNIRRLYKKITYKNSGVIPYNVAFKDALMDGKIINYIRDNIKCTKTDENYLFIKKVSSTAKKILDSVGIKSYVEGELK